MLRTMTATMTPDGTPQDPRLEGWSDQLYRSLVERVPAVVYIDSNDQRPDSLYLSPQAEDVFGHPPEAYLANPELWREQTHPEDVPLIAERWRAAREQERPFECEYRMIRPDGAVVWVRDGAVPVRDGEGRVQFWQGVLYDITAGKEHERALREAREKYRALVENLPAVVYISAPDDDRRTLYVSPHVERTLGYTREEWLGQPDIWMELLHPDDREPTLAAHDRHNESGEPWSREYRLIASDGRAIWFRDVATLVRDGDATYWQGLQLDITELKVVEDELRRARDELEQRVARRTAQLEEANALMSLEIAERRRAERELTDTERRYRALAEQIPAVTYTWEIGNPDLTSSYTSPRIEQLLGYTAETWSQSDELWISRVHPDDRQAVLSATMRSETTGEPFSREYRYLHKDGHIVWVHDEAAILSRTPDGKPWLFQGVMLDITARQEAESRARESELRYRDLTEQVPGVIYVMEMRVDASGFEVPYVSPQIREVFGFGPERWRDNEQWLATVHADDRDRIVAMLAEVERDGEPWVAEYRIVRADGRIARVRDRGRVLERDGLGRPRLMQGLVEDVTAERDAEEQVRDAEERYRTLVEQVPAMVYVEAPGPNPGESHFLYLSPQTEAVTGYAVEELMAEPAHFERVLHPDDRERVLAANARADEMGGPFDEVYRMIAKDGRVVWLHSRAVLVRDDDGRPRYWHGIALDVTESRRTQETLRALEQQYADLATRTFRNLGLEAE